MAEPPHHPESPIESAGTLVSGVRQELARLSGSILEQRYELGRILGQGGMGAVFEARHLLLDRVVAIKLLRPALADRREYGRRFLREARSASRIRHRNVVEILDYGETEDGLLYSVMEFLEGQDIEALLRDKPGQRIPWQQARELLLQVVTGLRAAHARGVIHRDIKPANCFVTSEDDEPLVKLVDFGIAKVDDLDDGAPLTATAQVIGTPSYIAPELIRASSLANAQSDIYSVGVLAYRMLAGRTPFSGRSLFEIFEQTCNATVPPIREQVPDIPASVEGFILDLLAKDPRDRPPDMSAIKSSLEKLTDESVDTRVYQKSASEDPRPSTRPPRVRRSRESEDTTVPRAPARGTKVVHRIQGDDEKPTVSDSPSSPGRTVKSVSTAEFASPRRSTSATERTELEAATERNDDAHRGASPALRRWAMAGLVLALGASLTWLAVSGSERESKALGPSGHVEDMASLRPSHMLMPDAGVETSAAEDEGLDQDLTTTEAIGAGQDDPAGDDSESGLTMEPRPAGTTGGSEQDSTDTSRSEEQEDVPPSVPPSSQEASRKRKTRARTTRAEVQPVPPDDEVLDGLSKKAEEQCPELMTEEPIIITFHIQPDGRASNVVKPPSSNAARCMEEIVLNARFRKRSMRAASFLKMKPKL